MTLKIALVVDRLYVKIELHVRCRSTLYTLVSFNRSLITFATLVVFICFNKMISLFVREIKKSLSITYRAGLDSTAASNNRLRMDRIYFCVTIAADIVTVYWNTCSALHVINVYCTPLESNHSFCKSF